MEIQTSFGDKVPLSSCAAIFVGMITSMAAVRFGPVNQFLLFTISGLSLWIAFVEIIRCNGKLTMSSKFVGFSAITTSAWSLIYGAYVLLQTMN